MCPPARECECITAGNLLAYDNWPCSVTLASLGGSRWFDNMHELSVIWESSLSRVRPPKTCQR